MQDAPALVLIGRSDLHSHTMPPILSAAWEKAGKRPQGGQGWPTTSRERTQALSRRLEPLLLNQSLVRSASMPPVNNVDAAQRAEVPPAPRGLVPGRVGYAGGLFPPSQTFDFVLAAQH